MNIGDYHSHTSHLSPMEDLAYRRLLDYYYLHEEPIINDIDFICRKIRFNDRSTDVQQVLNEFFTLVDNRWVNDRADSEILAFQGKKKQASDAGKASAEARKVNSKANVQQTFNDRSTDVQPNIIQEPLNNNHINTLVSNDVANCPHEEIIKLYAEHLPMLTQVKVWSDARMKLLKARWREDTKRQSIDWWERLFKFIATSDFLTGKSTDWQADIEWILNAKNFIKIIEGKYENKS